MFEHDDCINDLPTDEMLINWNEANEYTHDGDDDVDPADAERELAEGWPCANCNAVFGSRNDLAMHQEDEFAESEQESFLRSLPR